MKKVKLGSQGLEVSQIGLGCMGMTKFAGHDVYKTADEKEALLTIERSLELGGNFLDTADQYGPWENERFIAKAIHGKRDEYVIATKVGHEINDKGELTWGINATPQYVKKAAERSLKNLKTDCIDLYYLHRLDPNVPVEETVGAMADLVQEGKVKYLGLSEVSVNTIKKAHAVHPISALQSEFSLFERSVENAGILKAINEMGIGFVSYSPLGRGFLTGDIKSAEDLSEGDWRLNIPRFQGEYLQKNIELVKEIGKLASEKEVTTAQIALAWVISKGIIPIPGTSRRTNLEKNYASADIHLSDSEIKRLEEIIPPGADTGARYDEHGMESIDQ
ncbi:aldo/keto reductase [Chryseobacterium caseinilyticum]|uniref:Aldo/keto reductase n=1 Tax=Chryseobacterium caseinilyticum TaxID=2771428 RepID=A0ABR8Z6H6_9FLAO|nr:aldo/keto reductase [Chryseobacterium caseinilyticum]MBD8080811.1 aldo/keto reductase [Chryseobacterium caseinilyticum]